MIKTQLVSDQELMDKGVETVYRFVFDHDNQEWRPTSDFNWDLFASVAHTEFDILKSQDPASAQKWAKISIKIMKQLAKLYKATDDYSAYQYEKMIVLLHVNLIRLFGPIPDDKYLDPHIVEDWLKNRRPPIIRSWITGELVEAKSEKYLAELAQDLANALANKAPSP